MVAAGRKVWKRFEHAAPNAMWQMDFKGDVPFALDLAVPADRYRPSPSLQARGQAL